MFKSSKYDLYDKKHMKKSVRIEEVNKSMCMIYMMKKAYKENKGMRH